MQNPIELLNSFFILPAIKGGIRERIWEPIEDPKLIPIKNIWNDLGLLDKNGKLSELGEQIYNLTPLIDYFISLKDDFYNFSIHDEYKIDNNQYDLLREGLQIYHNYNNRELFNYFDMWGKEWDVLDYGGGKGQYIIDFIKDNPHSKGLLIDRNKIDMEDFEDKIISKAIDFEDNLNWYKEYENKFNLIILSEVLHCKDKSVQEWIILTCRKMLKDQGILLINENIPNPMFDWRMSMYTDGGKSIGVDEIRPLFFESLWSETRYAPEGFNGLNYHYQILFKAEKGDN